LFRKQNLALTTPSPSYKFNNPDAKIIIPFELSRNGIFLQARVNDSDPLWFTIDSGSAANYIDLTTAEKIGLDFRGIKTVRGAGEGLINVKVAEDVSFELPGLSSTGHTIHGVALPGPEQWGRPLDGLFGYNFLERFVTTINYPEKRFTIEEPLTFQYNGSGEILPINFQGQQPFVRARIKVPGNPAEESLFLIDTGSQDEVDHPLIAKTSQKTRTKVGVGLGSATTGVFGPVETLQLGKIQLQDLSGVAGGTGLGSHLIGGGVLHLFKIIFDYPRKRMILEP
jgi:aspartyl protease